MRVIAGEAKGRRLKSVPGDTTRPVTDRVKEAVFSILAPDLPGASMLDMFAGTGAIGIEALSRGAASVTFLDLEPRAVATIRDNLRTTGLEDGARVLRADALKWVAQANESFDIVYVAPPQYRGLWERALDALDGRQSVARDMVVVQIHPKEYRPAPLEYLELYDERAYGSTQVLFYVRREGEGAATQ